MVIGDYALITAETSKSQFPGICPSQRLLMAVIGDHNESIIFDGAAFLPNAVKSLD